MACGTLNCRFRQMCRKIHTKEVIDPDQCPEFTKYEDYAWDLESGDEALPFTDPFPDHFGYGYVSDGDGWE